ncbi:hypothetical protein K505DRAFT_339538 [Melanomma pulvis-pyrius CBS 109.77]|uniref:Uncharacterized protein n=1 Tax=Melanomma pulvis-pyrius CBS 109.77 TaxID=1314802 RepID=A0A6A6X5E4_9PLEO|nr:hypothetical protein K505DRAFT_339538 [Melanomma pulvis-pyrius CBS 109.77]
MSNTPPMIPSTDSSNLPVKTTAKEPVATPGKPPSTTPPKSSSTTEPQAMFKIPSTTPQLSKWNQKITDEKSHPLYFVRLTMEQHDLPQGSLLYDRLPRYLLFQFAPGLAQYLDPTNTDIVLPEGSADEFTVHDVVTAIIASAKQGTALKMHVDKKPINLIKIHAVLELFGMKKEAEEVRHQAWDAMGDHELKPEEVDWIWDTFGIWEVGIDDAVSTSGGKEKPTVDVKCLWKFASPKNEDEKIPDTAYVSPYASEYIEMMAWKILNLDALGRLDDVILRMMIDRFPTLKRVLATRKARYGLAKGVSESRSTATKLQTPTPEMANLQPESSVMEREMRLPKKITTKQTAGELEVGKLNFSRDDIGLRMPEQDRKFAPSYGLSKWIDDDPNRPSFMKSVEVSMRIDDEEPYIPFWQTPANAPMGSRGTSSEGVGMFGSGSVSAVVPAGPRAVQNGSMANNAWGISRPSRSISSSSGSSTISSNLGNYDDTADAKVFEQRPKNTPTGLGSFASTQNGSSDLNSFVFGGILPGSYNSASLAASNSFGSTPTPKPALPRNDGLISTNPQSLQSTSLTPTPTPSFTFGQPAIQPEASNDSLSVSFPSTVTQSFPSFGGSTAPHTPNASFNDSVNPVDEAANNMLAFIAGSLPTGGRKKAVPKARTKGRQ